MEILKIAGFALALLFSGCKFFDSPEGVVELVPSSVHTRSEISSATEEVVYCSADVKITNTGSSTIYDCTLSAVATSDKGIQHFVSMHYDVNIPPSQSLFITLEWKLVKKIETITQTSTSGNISENTSGSTSDHTSSSTTESTSGSTNSNANSETNGSASSSSSNSTSESTNNGTSNSSTNSTGGSTSSSSSTSTSTTDSITTTTVKPSDTNEESDWDKSSVKILDYFFN